MKIEEFIRRMRIQATAEGVPQTEAALKGLGQAYDKVGQSAAASAQVTDTSAKKQISMADSVERMERRYNSVYRAQVEFDRAQRQLNMAVEQTPEIQERANRVMALAYQRYQDVAAAADRAAAAQKKSAQDLVSRQTIIPNRGEDIASVGRDIDNVRSKYVPLVNIQRQYIQDLNELRSPLARAAMSEREREVAIQRTKDAFAQQIRNTDVATGSMSKYAGASGLARHELINMSRQIQDVGVSLSSGQSPMTVLIQQGTQIADIMGTSQGTVRGFLGQVGTWAKGVFTATRVAVGGIAAIGTTGLIAALQFSDGQREVEKSLVGIGRASGATRKDINRIAEESSSMFGLSTSEAREFASALAATGKIGVEQMSEVTKLGKQVAQVYGVDATEAAKMLAAAYAEPAKGAEELNKRLGAFDAATLRNIQSLVAQNRIMEAQQLITQGIKSGVEGISSAISSTTNFWTAMGNAISNAWGKFGEGVSRLTGIGLNLGLVEQIDTAARKVAQLRDDLERLPQTGQPIGTRGDIRGNMRLSASNQNRDQTEQDLMKEEHALRSLTEQWTKYGTTVEQVRGRIASHVERKLVMDALPFVGQFEAAEDRAKGLEQAIQKINQEIKETGASQTLQRMGMSFEQVQLAARATALAIAQIPEKMAAFKDQLSAGERLVEVNKELREKYPGMSLDVAKQSEGLKDQLQIAQALTGQEKMRSQEKATYNQLILEGKSQDEAALLAGEQRAVTQAGINAGAEEQLWQLQQQYNVVSAITGAQKIIAQGENTYIQLLRQGVEISLARKVANQQIANGFAQVTAAAENQLLLLRDQHAVMGAVTGAQKMAAQEVATYNRLVRDGVAPATASAYAAQERANSEAAVNAQIQQQIYGIGQQIELIEARNSGTEASVKAQHAYNDAIRAGADEMAAMAIQDATRRLANKQANSQKSGDFNVGPRELPRDDMFETGAIGKYGKGGYNLTSPGTSRIEMGHRAGSYSSIRTINFEGQSESNEQGLRFITDDLLGAGGSLQDAINKVMSIGSKQTGVYGQLVANEESKMTFLGQLINMLPEEQQATQLERILAEVRNQPVTLAREELVQSLTSKIEQLKKAVEENTIGLSDLYSAGHSGKIGFYQEGERTRLIDPSNPMSLPPSMMTNAIMLPTTSTQAIPSTTVNGKVLQHFGAANGMSAVVGGDGPPDSKYLSIRVSPAELINVTTPAQREAERYNKDWGKRIIQNFNISVKGDAGMGDRRTRRQVLEGIGNAAASSRTTH